MTRRHARLTAPLVLVLGLAACGSGASSTAATVAPATSPATTASAAPPAALLEIRTFSFRPTPLTVAAGRAVEVVNHDDTTHTITAGTPGAPTGEFDVSLKGPEASGRLPALAPGRYRFFCRIHTSMTGELVVG